MLLVIGVRRSELIQNGKFSRLSLGAVGNLAAANILAMLMTLALAPVLARALGPEGRGVAALIILCDEILLVAFSMGLPSAIGFAVKEGLLRGGQALRLALAHGLFFVPLGAVAGFALTRLIFNELSGVDRVLLTALFASAPVLGLMGESSKQILLARRDLRSARSLSLLQSGTRVALVLPAAAIGLLGVTWAALSLRLSYYVSGAYALIRAGERLERGGHWRQLAAFGLRGMPGSFANLANSRLDQLLIAPFLGFGQLGLYAVAVAVNIGLMTVASALANDAVGRVRVSREGIAEGARAVRRSWVVLVVIALITGIGATIALEPVFGQNFAGALAPTLLLLPGTALGGVNLVAQQVSTALGRPGHGSVAQLVGLAAMALLIPAGVAIAGLAGAAAGVSLASAGRLLTMFYLLRRHGLSGLTPGARDIADVWARLRSRP